MRLYEFESKTKAEVYIDMDGVLVDFFDAWAKLMGEKSFRDIKDIDKGLQAIRDEDNFWLNLKPTPNAGKLLALVRELKGSYTILSSPLADDPRSEPHKRMWVEKNLKQFPPKKVIITGNKAKYAQQSDGTPNILIDDFGQNIDKWNAAGGIGVKHKDHKFERTFKSLMNHLKKDEKTTEDDLEEISAKDIGAGALAGLMALTPVSKAFGQDANTNPLPNKQTSTMVQKDVGGKQDLSKISNTVNLKIVLDNGKEFDFGPWKSSAWAKKTIFAFDKKIEDVLGPGVGWKAYKGDATKPVAFSDPIGGGISRAEFDAMKQKQANYKR